MTNQRRVYYAHCKSVYGTKQETRDIILLSHLGFTVINPGSKKIEAEYQQWKESTKHIQDRNDVEFFLNLIDACDIIAFRGLPFTDLISSGVHMEVCYGMGKNIPVIELPTNVHGRGLDHERTVEYLKEVGER